MTKETWARVLRIAVIAVAGLVVALFWAYSAVFSTLKGEMTLWSMHKLGLSASAADILAWVLALVLTPLALKWLFRAMTGQLAPLERLQMVGAAALVVLLLAWARTDWMFDSEGRSLLYLCDGLVSGGMPRIQVLEVDSVTGKRCGRLDAESARTVYAMRQGVSPEPIEIATTQQLDELELFDGRNGSPLVYEGVAPPASALPRRLYRNPGFDPHAPQLLKPLSRETKTQLRAALDGAERRAREAAAASAKEQEKRRKQSDSRERALVIGAARRAMKSLDLAAVEQAGLPATLAAASSPQAGHQVGRRIERTVDLGVPSRQWPEFFSLDTEARTGQRSTAYFLVRNRAASLPASVIHDVTLDTGSLPATSIAKPAFFAALDLPSILLGGNVDSLRAIAFPPGIDSFYFVDIVDSCDECAPKWVTVRWLEVELPARRLIFRIERKYL